MSGDIEMVWLDIETTGLSTQDDVILEVGLMLTDRWGTKIDGWSSLVDSPGSSVAIPGMSTFVHDMHVKSELLRDWNEANQDGRLLSAHDVAMEAVEWLADYELKYQTMPTCGSSVQFDRAMLGVAMPWLNDWFHYRNIDVSTLKNVCSLVNPILFEKRPPENKDYKHRPFNCLEGSIAEYQWYLDNFLFVGDEVL